MANLPSQSFNQIVTNTIAGIQGRSAKLINFSTGSALRSIVEGFAGLFLWFQAMVLQLLSAMRLSTAVGADVDSFTADFMPTIGVSNGVASPRLGSQAATGQVTFARFTAAPSTCFVPVGATLTTSDGTNTQFAVISDTTNPYYSATLQGYTLPSSTLSMTVAVEASVAGSAGNVAANTITVMTSPITGIDTVTNIAAFTNGADQESDSALKARFAAYILGLSRGDIYGLNASILGTDVTVQYALTEGYNLDGSYRPGYFFVVADDGSGNPPQSFLQTVTDAVQAVRPLAMQAGVFPPTIIQANVSMQITTASTYDHNTVIAQVAALVATNIDSLGLGNSLFWSQIAAWAYTVPGVTSVQNVQINGVYGDAASLITTQTTQDGTLNYVTSTVKANDVTVS
jgi:phage-related baseplate assembly protein